MLGFRDSGFPEDGLRLVDETYKELLNFNVEELAIMPVEKFMEVIRKVGYSPTYLDVLAQLAHETANTYQAQENKQYAQSFYLKGLQLYHLLNEKDKTFSFEREMIISELEKITSQ